MELTNKQKVIKDRRISVMSAYNNRGALAVTILVKSLAKKFNVTEVTIYNDIKLESTPDMLGQTITD
jgi:DeoR/GlpR family transcriptional regulator of sugar metabolism